MPDILPNSLTKTPLIDWEHSRNGTVWFRVFCANCAAEVARVMDTMLPAQYAFALCNDCVEKYGEPAGVARTPDDIWRAKVEAAMVESYGRVLTEQEIEIELSDGASVISKLEREGHQRSL